MQGVSSSPKSYQEIVKSLVQSLALFFLLFLIEVVASHVINCSFHPCPSSCSSRE